MARPPATSSTLSAESIWTLGLPLAVAFEAAMADYQCHFEPQELCLA